MSPERLAEIGRPLPGLRIAVVGDFFLDKYLDVRPGPGRGEHRDGQDGPPGGGRAPQPRGGRHGRLEPGRARARARSTRWASPATTASRTTCAATWPRWAARPNAPGLRPRAHDAHVPEAARRERPQPGRRAQPLRHQEPHAHAATSRSGGSSPSLDALLPQVGRRDRLDQVEEEDCGVITRGVFRGPGRPRAPAPGRGLLGRQPAADPPLPQRHGDQAEPVRGRGRAEPAARESGSARSAAGEPSTTAGDDRRARLRHRGAKTGCW